MIKSVKEPATIDNQCTKLVYINRFQHHYVPRQCNAAMLNNTIDHLEWTPLLVEHVILQPTEKMC